LQISVSKAGPNHKPTQHSWNPSRRQASPSADCRLPQAQQRRLFDAFHLELHYNDITNELDTRVTITGDTATTLGATVQAVLDSPDGGPGGADPVTRPITCSG
jgi:hypothetical protein